MPSSSLTTLLDRWVLSGGAMMVFIVPAAILTVAYALQGFLNLRRARIAPPELVRLLADSRKRGGPSAAKRVLADSRSSLSSVVLNTLARIEEKGERDAPALLREEIERECDLLLHQNSQLSIIYTLAPLLGLLGTVIGMLKAFGGFTSVENLASGINIALTNTAWGLGIAIPAFLMLSLLRRRIHTYELFILPPASLEALTILLDGVEERSDTGSSERTRPMVAGR